GEGRASAANSLQNAKDKQEYCSQQYQDKLIDPNNAAEVNNIYHYLCPEKQIGSVTGAASGIDAFFSSSIGQALKKVADTWRAATSNPFVGFIRAVGDGISFIINAVVQPILKITGIQGKINDLLQYMTGKVAELAGIKPIIDNNGSNSPLITGQVVNAAIQGGAATAEMSMRSAGAARTTAQSQAEAVQLVDNYSKATSSQTSIYTKYASLDNPNSFASKTLSSFAQTKSSIISMFSNVLSNIGSIFSAGQYARASSSSAYSAANFAGIDTYDYPAQCINADPLLMTPQNSTNVKDVLGDSVNSQLTWDIVTDSSKFYDFIYSQDKIANSDDPDSIASQIYNCELLDNNVRGGLGALYGYTKDHGLETTDTSSGNPSNIAAPNFIQMWGGSSQAAIDAMVNSQAPFKPNTLVIHFTEGTGEGMELVNFLDSEGAGIQFNIGTTGKIYEFFPLDAMKETANVGYMNSKVIGIEISARDGMDLLNNQTQFNAVVSTVQFLCSYYHFPCSDPKGEITNSSMADAQGLLGHDEVIEPDLSKQHSDPDTKVVGGTLYNICTNRPWTQADRHDASTHAYMLKLRRALGYTSFTTGTANCAPGGSVGL
ncbi:MAG TPA: N-acetylmuramoyl-L-alanine amidase, partial [Patescibacteria group bacterium]|nr:N-acetylmuramoyl-L-alanine amidase [Patescibacteria group bacterium]